MPQVSVVIPSYKRADTVAKSIDSVLRQTFQDFEIIVVDDASGDNTEAIVRSIGDSRIRYLSHALNQGGAAARNTGIQASTADYIAFLDSDDEWLPEKLEKQMNVLKNSGDGVGVVYSGIFRITPSLDKKEEIYPKHSGRFLNSLLVVNCVGTFSCVVIKRRYLEMVNGLDPNMRSCQDWDLFIRLNKVCDFVYVDECLVNYYVIQNPNRISSDKSAIIKGHNRLKEKFKDDYAQLDAKHHAEHLDYLSMVYIAGGDLQSGLKCALEAFKLTKQPRYLIKAGRCLGSFVKRKLTGAYGF